MKPDLPTPSMPPEFLDQVKQALEHLYDFSFLQGQPLAQMMGATKRRSSETLGHHLRRELITGIEALNPEPGASLHSPDARLYNLLQLHFVEGLKVQEVASRLGLSTRQAHRSLRRAEEGVAAVLWARIPQHDDSANSAFQLSSLQAEVALLETNLQPIDLRGLLNEARSAVAPLAAAHQVEMEMELPAQPVIISTDAAVSRQLLVSILSRIIQSRKLGPLKLGIASAQKKVSVRFTFQGDAQDEIYSQLDQVIAPLTERVGWQVSKSPKESGVSTIEVSMAAHGPLVLVIDDNEGLVQLLERYLTGHKCRVLAATSGAEGLQLSKQVIPDAVILDAMMPEVSGWEVLQTLRSQPQTAGIPVIICSVFNDPDLAYALGASLFISKPVSREDILDGLRQLDVV